MRALSLLLIPLVTLLSCPTLARILAVGDVAKYGEIPGPSLPPRNPGSPRRRATPFTIQPPGGQTQPNGWTSYFTPLMPFDSTDKPAADLLKFYDLLQSEVKDLLSQNYPTGDELILEDNQINLHVRCDGIGPNHAITPLPDRQIMLDFLAYMVSPSLLIAKRPGEWASCSVYKGDE